MWIRLLSSALVDCAVFWSAHFYLKKELHLNIHSHLQNEKLSSSLNRNGVEMHKTFISTWTVSRRRKKNASETNSYWEREAVRTEYEYEATHFLTRHKIGNEDNDAHQYAASFFFLLPHKQTLLLNYFRFMHNRHGNNWTQVRGMEFTVCGMGNGCCECFEIEWLGLEMFILIVSLVHWKWYQYETITTLVRRRKSGQLHNHQKNSKEYHCLKYDLIDSVHFYCRHSIGGRLFFTREKKTIRLFSAYLKILFLHRPGKKVYIPLLLLLLFRAL